MKLLSTTEAAAILNVTPREVQRLCAGNLIPHQRIGSRYALTEEAIAEYRPARRGPKGPRKKTDETP